MVTVVKKLEEDLGRNTRLLVFDLAFDASYPTGGEPVAAALAPYGIRKIVYLSAESKGGYLFAYDVVNKKLLAYVTKDPADAGGADVVMQQVASTTDLSAVTGVRVLVLAARG